MTTKTLVCAVAAAVLVTTHALIPFIDGGKELPKLYQCYFDSQISKQACTAVAKALQAGHRRIEVNFPPVPNVEEVRFGTPLNQKFGKTIVARDLRVPGGYKPGSDVSRQLIAFSNMYWAKQLAGAMSGSVSVVSAEPLNTNQVKGLGPVKNLRLMMGQQRNVDKYDSCIAINPGGEETWERVRSSVVKNDRSPFVVLNSAYSTTYGLGNKAGYEEAYYLKRISKGYVFRAFPGPWCAYLEKPDTSVELLETYDTKPQLNEVAKLVREESFQRFAIGNDRWTAGFGGRL